MSTALPPPPRPKRPSKSGVVQPVAINNVAINKTDDISKKHQDVPSSSVPGSLHSDASNIGSGNISLRKTDATEKSPASKAKTSKNTLNKNALNKNSVSKSSVCNVADQPDAAAFVAGSIPNTIPHVAHSPSNAALSNKDLSDALHLAASPSTAKRNPKNIPKPSSAGPLDYFEENTNGERLMGLVKKFHAALLSSSGSSTARTRRAESSVKMALEILASHCVDVDAEIEYALNGLSSNIEQKSLLRDVVSNCFGRRTGALNAVISLPPSLNENILTESSRTSLNTATTPKPNPSRRKTDAEQVVIVDVFALPFFGSLEAMSMLMRDASAMAKLTEFTMGSGYITSQSDCVALMKVPLSWDALSRPSLLNSLSSNWGYQLAHGAQSDPFVARAIERTTIELLQQFEVTEGERGFVLPGVRIWKGSLDEYHASSDMLSQWSRVGATARLVGLSWWQVVTSQIFIDAGILPGSLMVRPPATPLVAQAQSLAWHLAQQLYDRLDDAPFGEINFETVADNKLALRAYGRTGRVLAQSDVVSLFDVTSSAEDFTAVLNEECDSNGPKTQRRLKLRRP